jgi:hypothetical protein
MNELEAIWDKIDEATEAPSPERDARLSTALKRLDAMRQDDPEVLFAKGYALYFYPDRITNAVRQTETEHIFLMALRRDPSHERARLYLGHHYYDIGRYHDDLACFIGIPEEHLNRLLVLKARELAACCRLILEDDLMCATPELDSYFNLAQESSEYDVLPIHLVEVSKRRLLESPQRAHAKLIYRKLRELLYKMGLGEIFAADISELDRQLLGETH